MSRVGGGSWLCPAELDRARLLDMTQRILPASMALAVVCAPIVVLLILRVGPVFVVPYVVAAVMQQVIGTVLMRRRRPEYWLFAGDCVATASIAAAIAITGGVRSPILAFFIFPLVAVAGRHTLRGLALFSVFVVTSTLAACVLAANRGVRYDDLRLVGELTVVAGVLTLLLALMRAERLYREQSLLDPLTGTLNRLALARRLEELGAQAAVEHGRLCVLVADLDRFKSVNDAYGHEVGDTVLCKVADVLRHSLRAFPLLYRTGGEEFVALLPGLTTAEGGRVAEGLRRAVAATRPNGIDVTMSFGVASGGGTAMPPNAVLLAADRCLYQAKHRGRNQVFTQPTASDAGQPRENVTTPERTGELMAVASGSRSG